MTVPPRQRLPAGDQRRLMERVQSFADRLRQAGLVVTTDRLQVMLAALRALGPAELYRAGRLTLCAGPDDLARYDEVWRSLAGAPPATVAAAPRPTRRAVALFDPDGAGDPAPGTESETPLSALATGEETLRQRDLAALTTAERAEVRRLLALLAPALPQRRSRRHRRAPTGGVDPRATLRATLRGLGEPGRLIRRRPGRRPRRLVLLLDISGSMAPYADSLLRFAHAAVRAGPAGTEVFTVGTRLTRISAALRPADPDAALRLAGAQLPDWRGGTRLGDALGQYLRRYGHRGMARRAVVVIFSDGWECGDAARLGAAVAWLSRLAHRVVWVTPHAGRPGFAPTAAGLAAAYPHLDRLVAGHSLAALTELVALLRDGRP